MRRTQKSAEHVKRNQQNDKENMKREMNNQNKHKTILTMCCLFESLKPIDHQHVEYCPLPQSRPTHLVVYKFMFRCVMCLCLSIRCSNSSYVIEVPHASKCTNTFITIDCMKPSMPKSAQVIYVSVVSCTPFDNHVTSVVRAYFDLNQLSWYSIFL